MPVVHVPLEIRAWMRAILIRVTTKEHVNQMDKIMARFCVNARTGGPGQPAGPARQGGPGPTASIIRVSAIRAKTKAFVPSGPAPKAVIRAPALKGIAGPPATSTVAILIRVKTMEYVH